MLTFMEFFNNLCVCFFSLFNWNRAFCVVTICVFFVFYLLSSYQYIMYVCHTTSKHFTKKYTLRIFCYNIFNKQLIIKIYIYIQQTVNSIINYAIKFNKLCVLIVYFKRQTILNNKKKKSQIVNHTTRLMQLITAISLLTITFKK